MGAVSKLACGGQVKKVATPQPKADDTQYQKYGMGYRKVRG
jgi:hypothetical protein